MGESKPKIVLVDDDQFWAKTIIRELSKLFEVVYLETAKQAIDFLEDRYDIDGVILDIMMEAPEGMDGETEDGQLTGVNVLRAISNFVVVTNIPVLVFSNHHDMPRVEELTRAIPGIGERLEVRDKHSISRKELGPFLMAKVRAVKGL